MTPDGLLAKQTFFCSHARKHEGGKPLPTLIQKLKSWLRKKSIANMLVAYDTTDIYEVGFEGKSSKMTDSTTARSRLFLDMLGIEGCGKAQSSGKHVHCSMGVIHFM